MYAPLEYLKQVKNYFLIFNDTVGTQDAINKMVTDCVDNYFDTDSNLYDLWYDYAKHSNRTARIGKYPKVIRDKYEKLGNDVTLSIAKALNSVNERGINGLVSAKYMFDETPYDTFNFYFTNSIRYAWSKTRMAYKVEKELARMLINIEADPSIALECFKNQPTNIYYIDTADLGGYLCEGMEGFFVASILHKGSLVININPIIRGKNGRVIPLFSTFSMPIGDGVDGVTFIYPGVETVQITLEDGHTYQYRQKDTIWLFLNLILYLNAGNKDVEKSEVTRKYEKRSKEEGSKETPKPKDYAYKDIKQYEVGYRLVIERRKQDKNNSKGSGGKGSKKSPHFRKGHWHHWWVGSGEKRHLELRWQEGILVNGGPSDNSLVSVHKVN